MYVVDILLNKRLPWYKRLEICGGNEKSAMERLLREYSDRVAIVETEHDDVDADFKDVMDHLTEHYAGAAFYLGMQR